MKKQTFFFRINYLKVLSFLILFLFFKLSLFGQTKIIANQVTATSGNKIALLCGGLLPDCPPTVANPNHATANDETYARLYASPGLAINLGAFQAFIELKFPEVLPANTWSYVKIKGDTDLFKALLGGSLGNTLGGVLDAVLSGNQEMTFDARMGENSVLSRSSTLGFETDNVKMLVDAEGNYILAMRPAGEYDRIRITNKTGAFIGVGVEKTLDVYNAYYYEDTDQNCGRPIFTSFDGSSGLSLSILPIEDESLKYAIDGDLETYSTLKSSSVLDLSVAGSISQNFYFPTTTDASSTLNIKLAFGSQQLLDLKVLSGLDLIFKNNDQVVATKSLNSGLLARTDLLGLLQEGKPVTLSFGLGVAFNQVEIRSNALVGLSLLAADLKIYDIQRYDEVVCFNPNLTPTTPTPPMLSHKSCSSTLISHQNANFPTNAVDGNNDSYTTLEASSGIAVGLGAYNGHVEMGIDVAANKTTYVRIDFDEQVLGGLLNGSLGGLLDGVISNIVFGNHYFTVEGINNDTTVFSRSTNDGLASGVGAGNARIVQDKNGHYYVAITPESAITSIRITEKLPSWIGLGTVKTMNVYHACYATGSDSCEQGFATFSTSDGISLDLLDIGGAGVRLAENAIDGDLATSSKVSVGAVGIGGSMFQHVQFHGLSSERDHFRVKMKMQASGLVTADVLGSVIVKAYNGEEEVYSQRLNERLIPGLDLLGLLSNGGMINIPFSPGYEFDRVAVGMASLVDVDVLANPLEIYSIERFSNHCPDPELNWDPKTTPPFNAPACGVSLVDFENVNFPYEAVTNSITNDTYATLSAGAGIAFDLGAYSSHIELKYSGAGAEANEVSYIRVDEEIGLFDALLSGSLGNALGNLLGTIALGNQYIVIQAKDANGANVGTAHSSMAGFNTEFVRLVKDIDGRFYLAVTAPSAYQSIRIEYHHTALVGASGSSSINVYSMCRETSFDACEQAAFTSWDGNGIALDLADLTKGGVANPEFAIDANSSNYATLNMGVAGVAAWVSQRIYFKTKSNETDKLRVRLQLATPGILNLDVFGGSELIFYNGEDLVKEMTLKSGLVNNLDLLALFNSGGIQSFTFTPGVVYDRVELKISSLLTVNTSAPIRLYEMSRISDACPTPNFLDPQDVFNSPACIDGVEVSNVRAVDDVDFAIDGDYNSYATMRSDSGAIFGIGKEESILELKYPGEIPANTTSYLRLDDDAGILESLLSGSIGKIVYSLVNQVALGNNYFVVRAKNGADEVLVGSSKDNFEEANGLMKIVQDKAGRYFVAISPDVAYTSIEIKAFSESLLGILANAYNLHIYGMCYETDFSGCAEGFSTSWDGSGLSVGITGIGAYGVTDAFKALNNNNNSDYSTLSLGTLDVAGHVQQNIQFNKTIPANSMFRMKMEFGAGTLNTSVISNIAIIAYKDGQEVFNKPIQNAVLADINILNLFNNGGAHDVSFIINEEVDEIGLRMNSLLNVSVGPDIKLYYIVQDCNAPSLTAWKSAEVLGVSPGVNSVAGGEEIEYTIHIRNTGSVALNNYKVHDAVPMHTTFVSAENAGELIDGVVVFKGINIAPGTTETVSFKVLVTGNLTGLTQIKNIGLVKSAATDPGIETWPPMITDPNEPDDTGDTGTLVPVDQIRQVISWKAYDINGDKTISSVSGGEEVNYHIYIRNTGNQDLLEVLVTDELPAGVTYISGGVLSGNLVTFDIPSLVVGDVAGPFTFKVRVNNDLTDITKITNIAVVKTDPTDPDTESYPPIDNTDPTEPDTTQPPGTVLEVSPKHKVEILKTGISNNLIDTAQVQLGDEIEYTITLKNTGNKTLTNLRLTDTLPESLSIISFSSGEVSGNSFSVVITSLAVDEEISFSIRTSVDNLDVGVDEIENIATVIYRNEENTADITETDTHIMPVICVEIETDDIILTPTSLDICEGELLTIKASTDLMGLDNPVYKWYADASLTEVIFEGEELVLPEGITGTTVYYLSLEADGYCFNGPAKEISITAKPKPETPEISVGETGAIVCSGTAVTLKSSAAEGNVWYKDGVEITGANEQEITVYQAGVYTVVVTDSSISCSSLPSNEITVVLEENPILELTGEHTFSIGIGESITLPVVTSPNGGDIKWFTNSGEEILQTVLTFDTAGVYYYNVVATLGNCSVSDWIQVIVTDFEACGLPDERVYATSQYSAGSGGTVANGSNAISGDPYSYSTLTSVIGAIGLGLAGQGLQWDHTIPAGTPVTIKLGSEYSGLALAGAISVVGTKKNALGHAMDIGTLTPADGNILSLLSGRNSFEITFIPTNILGKPRDYDGVKILVAGLLSVAQNANVYGAYYKTPSTEGVYDCNLPEVRDIYYGTYAPVIDALGSTTGVADEWLAVDGDPDTKATMYLGAAVANQTYLNVEFRTPFRKNDILKITMSPDHGLSVDLLTGLVIRRYLGDHKVGPDITQFNFLNLIGTDNKAQVIVPVLEDYEPFDRVEIFKAGVANVFSFIDIYEIERIISPENIIDGVEIVDGKGFVINDAICDNGSIDLNVNADDGCTTYLWYNEDNELIGTGTSLQMSGVYDAGEHKVYLQPVRYGCENLARTEIIFTVEKCSNNLMITNPMIIQRMKLK